MPSRASFIPFVAFVAALQIACEKHDSAGTGMAADAGAPAGQGVAPPSTVVPGAWRFSVDPGGVARVDMPGLKEDIQGDASGARGWLDVVSADLTRSRGQVEFDLATFATHTFHSDKDMTQTEHARTWLEVKVGDQQNEAMRWATFVIRSVEVPGAASLTAAPVAQEGGDDVRTVRMKLHGDLRIHGHALPQDAAVDVAFRFAHGAPGSAPARRVEVRSTEPMRLALKDYDVRPRDPAGQLVAWTTQLVSKVAETADVTVEFGASPAR
jgi:hypothetical protein